jgi:hypothetical protein
MDSEVTNLAQVKAFDSSDYATAAQGTLAAAALPKSGGAMTGAITVGVDDTGYDVKFFGATAGKSLLWDESADSLIVTGDIKITQAAGGTFLKFDVDGTTDEATVGMDATDLIIDIDPTNARANSDFIIKNDGTETFRIASNGTATFAGEITANGGIALGDNDKATFGVSDDLQIYHDGSHSYIDDVGGTGNLKVRATNLVLQSAIDENYATFVANGAAALFYDNAAKLATTSTGIDVTGVITTDGMTITTADNAAQITLISTDADASVGPLIDLTRDSASPAANDTLGRVRFRGEDANGDVTAYAQITGKISSTSAGAVDGQVQFQTMRAGTQKVSLNLNATEAVFNESSEDYDFRVESNGDTHALFVEASSGNIGVGTSSPATLLDVDGTLTTNALVVEGDATVGDDLSLLSDSSKINFGLHSDVSLTHQHNSGLLLNSTRRLYFNDTSQYIYGSDTTRLKMGATNEIELNAALIDVNGALDVSGTLTVQGGITEDAVTLAGTSTTIDLSVATNFVHDLTGATTYTFSNPAATGNASSFTLKIIQDSTARTITWPSTVDWAGGTAPTLTTTANGVDVFVFYTIDGGTNYYGFTAGQGMA